MPESKPNRDEEGARWWIRYVLVPLLGSGGVIAILVALVNRPSPASRLEPLTTQIDKSPIAPGPQAFVTGRSNGGDGRPEQAYPVLVEEAFNPGSRWPTSERWSQHGAASPSITGGQYCWSLKVSNPQGGGWFHSAPDLPALQNAFVEVDVRFDTLTDGDMSAGVILRLTNEYEYEMMLNPRGFIEVVAVTQQGTHKVLDWVPMPAAAGMTWRRIGLAARGDSLTPYVDGKPLPVLVDATLRFGTVGLIVRSDGARSGTICFDNLSVKAP